MINDYDIVCFRVLERFADWLQLGPILFIQVHMVEDNKRHSLNVASYIERNGLQEQKTYGINRQTRLFL